MNDVPQSGTQSSQSGIEKDNGAEKLARKRCKRYESQLLKYCEGRIKRFWKGDPRIKKRASLSSTSPL